MARKKTTQQPRLVTRRELGELLGKHPQTVTGWERSGMPIATRGRRGVPSQYDVWAVLQWHVDRVRPHGDALCLETERAGLARAQRQRIEREDRLKAGELMEAADVERQFSSIASTVKAKMRALPSAVATQVVGLAASGPGAVQAFLLRQIDAALRELVRAGLAEADRAGK